METLWQYFPPPSICRIITQKGNVPYISRLLTNSSFLKATLCISINVQHQIWRKAVQHFRGNKLIEYHQWEQSAEALWVCEIPEPLLRFSTNRGSGNSKQQFWKAHGAVPWNFIFLYTNFLIQNVKIYPASLKHSAFQCCRRLPTGIAPDLKLSKQEERERITEVNPQHEEV